MSTLSRFVRALEAEYEARVSTALEGGVNAEDAHRHAFDHARSQGARVLLELRRVGLCTVSATNSEGQP